MKEIVELQAIVDGPDAEAAVVALVELGLAHRDAGRPDLAEAAFLRVIGTRHEGQAARAAFELAQLYEEHGDAEGAREAYRFVLEAGGHGLVGPAVCGLRRLRE
jgi:tetratricopeptide (TPR) repeat protein